jgi:hypothetical protein
MAAQRGFRGERLSLALIVPHALRVTMVTMISGFGLIILSVLGSMRDAELPHNPFTAYADVFPGQPIQALNAHGFVCSSPDYSYRHDPAETHCVLRPEQGAFSYIEAAYSKDVIQLLHFGIRGSAINVGELVVMLELTDIRPHGELFFAWRGHFSRAKLAYPAKHVSALRFVKQVTLTDSGLSMP